MPNAHQPMYNSLPAGGASPTDRPNWPPVDPPVSIRVRAWGSGFSGSRHRDRDATRLNVTVQKIVHHCQEMFHFELPSIMLQRLLETFEIEHCNAETALIKFFFS